MGRPKVVDPVEANMPLLFAPSTVGTVRQDIQAQLVFLNSLGERYSSALTSLERFDSDMIVELKFVNRVDFFSDISLIFKL